MENAQHAKTETIATLTTMISEPSDLETIASPLVDTSEYKPMTEPSSMTTIPGPGTTIEYELSTEEVQMTTLDYGNESEIELWFFEESQASCAQFEYLGAGGNANRFVDEATCMRVCGTEFVSAVHGEADHRAGEANYALCELPLEIGNGAFKIPRFYFNKGEEKCEPFDYTGDGGNGNRFLTEEDCKQLCLANQYNQELASPQGDDSSGDKASALDWTIFIVLCIVVFLLIIILITVLICCIMLATKKGRAAAGLSAASGKPKTNKNAKNPKKPTKGAKAKTK
ncbi:unnamed protein product [Haemonchus placei]|uniref:BPTI/Kunitz inhibitor domain-containing protein n=1 Tax=Haemonchus placei TaxID=6290 RepID=A0A158QLQ8_HAEPC|nr:unnamed protein product [Haemonchus placei]